MRNIPALSIIAMFLTACSLDAKIEETFGEAGAFTAVAAEVRENHNALVGLGADVKKQQVVSSKYNKFIVMSSVGDSMDENFQEKNGWTVRMSLVGTTSSLTGTSD